MECAYIITSNEQRLYTHIHNTVFANKSKHCVFAQNLVCKNAHLTRSASGVSLSTTKAGRRIRFRPSLLLTNRWTGGEPLLVVASLGTKDDRAYNELIYDLIALAADTSVCRSNVLIFVGSAGGAQGSYFLFSIKTVIVCDGLQVIELKSASTVASFPLIPRSLLNSNEFP